MKKALWLASWYPNRIEPLAGDFIERHARAASIENEVSVIYVVKDYQDAGRESVSKEKRFYNNQGDATIVYYQVPFKNIKWLNRVLSAFIFLKRFIREVRLYISQNGKPDLVHVHVAQKVGLVALWLKWYYRLPYVVTEHWTGFCAGARPNFNDQGYLSKLLWKVIMLQASGCSTVSDFLGREIKSRLKNLEYHVIPNVVDTAIFRPGIRNKQETFRFIHVSTLGYQKNPQQLFEAVRILSQTTKRQFTLMIYGKPSPELVLLSETLHIQQYLVFKNETTQTELAVDMTQADALILYSRYETFGCVIIEANACGVPVIVSDIAVFHENVLNNTTGVFAPLNDPQGLAARLLWMMENTAHFDSAKIVDITKAKYGFDIVGQQFDRFYDRALRNY